MDEQELQRIFDKLNAGVDLTDEEMKKLAANTSVAAAAMQSLNNGLKVLGKSALDVAGKMYKGEQGAAAYNDAITKSTDALGDFIGKFGLIGKVIGTLVKAAGKYAAEVNQMSDRLYENYQTLSRAGIAAEDGMMGLADASQRLGYGLDKVGLDAFARLMTAASKDLSMLSGSAVDGRKNFVDFSSALVRSETGEYLMNLGMSVDSINEGVAGFVKQQVSLGRAQTMSNKQLQEGAAAYLKEMDLLTKLTGMQKQELEAQMDANRRNERFRAAIEKVRREQGDDAAQALEMNMAVAAERFPELSKGLMDIAAGFLNTEDAQKVFRAGMQDVPQMMTRGIGSGFKEIGIAARQTADSFGGLAEFGAYGDVFGNYYETLKAAGMAEEDARKRALELAEAQKKQGEGAEGVTGAQTQMRRAQMDTRDALQDMVKAGVAPATRAMSGFAKMTGKVVGMSEEALGIKAAPGGKMQGGGGAAGGGAAGGGGKASGAAGPAGGGAAGGAGGGKVYQGGVMGAIENFMTGGRGFNSYSTYGINGGGEKSPGDVTSKLLNFIGKIEGRGDYNILVGGKSLPELTEMTVAQVLEYQSGMRAQGHESTAVGKYQIIQGTLRGLLQRGVVNPDDVFNASTQDKLAVALMQGRGLDKYESGKIPADVFADNLAKEWASLPTATGQSYYAGTGSNKSLVSRDEFMSVFARNGGVFAGPKSGYAATLHGTEAVVPLPDGKTIPVEMPALTDSMSEQSGILTAQLMKLDELIVAMRDNTNVTTKILQATNN